MNAQKIIDDLNEIIAESTGFSEHIPRTQRDVSNEPLPNTGLYRLAIVGVGKEGDAGLDRFLVISIIVVHPLSGGDQNRTNEQAAIASEQLITDISDYNEPDCFVNDDIEGRITKENGRLITVIDARVSYQIS